jgi:hypothetical protein
MGRKLPFLEIRRCNTNAAVGYPLSAGAGRRAIQFLARGLSHLLAINRSEKQWAWTGKSPSFKG